ncbi:hypothetical protein [Streptomyces sp. NPDC053427]|uniref:hypothetical protein n=1 Tax=Streptomyces sp. NPDC053427 TaxID=3365701 RepID=UPI0037D3F987
MSRSVTYDDRHHRLRTDRSAKGPAQVTADPPPYLRHALQLADPATADALAERLRPELLAVLADRFGLPEELVEVLAGPDAAGLRAALTADPGAFLTAAAERGDPVVGLALWRAEFRDASGRKLRATEAIPSLLAAVLHAADPLDRRWYDEDDGLIPVLYEEAVGPVLVPALTSRFPGLVTGSVAQLGPHLPPPVVLDAFIGLVEFWGADALVRFLSLAEEMPELAGLGHPWLPGLLRQALDAPDPESFLREHRPAGEWTDPEHVRVLLELRYGDGPSVRPDGLDWDLIRREHDRLPLGHDPRRAPDLPQRVRLLRLVQWEGCPADLVRESFREVPRETARFAAELPFEALLHPELRMHRTDLRDVLERGIAEGRLPVDRVLTEVAPAETVLNALPYGHEPTRKALAGLLTRLGTDPVNWLTCYARTGRAHGSVAELIADAASTTTGGKRCSAWPRPAPAQFPAGPPQDARRAFLGMFRCASPEAQRAVVPYLDARAVQHLLVHGDPSPEIRDAVVAAHGLPAQVAMAAAYDLSAEKLEYLLDLDEPAVDAQLFRYADLDRAERERMLAGRLRGGGIRAVPPELLATVEEISVSHHRPWLMAGLESGDPGVARALVGRLRLHVPATRLRLLVAVWERGGPDAVREILAMDRLPLTLRRRTEKLLDAPDGPDRIRALLAAEESPDRLAAFLMRAGSRPGERLHRLRSEGLEPPWPALVAAREAGTLPDGLLDALADHPGCPRALLLAAPANLRGAGTDRLHDALLSGRLTPEDVLTRAAPAHAALDRLRRYAADRSALRGLHAVRGRARALTREHLATDAEAWAVALQLLPTFAGTLPELLATAGAMTRVHH